MWNKPQLLTALTDLLHMVVGAALILLVIHVVIRMPLFPLRQAVFTQSFVKIQREDVNSILSGPMAANFFNMKVDEVQRKLEGLPWVRRAEVRRSGPYRLEINLEEHKALARWGESSGRLVNSFGEIFAAPSNDALPVLVGPEGSAANILSRYGEFSDILRPTGLYPRQVTLSARLAWQLLLSDGSIIELGREQNPKEINERLTRFASNYPVLLTELKKRGASQMAAADLRYPNGFALHLADGLALKDGTHKEGI